MKLILAALAVFGLLLAGIMIAGGGHEASAGPLATETRAPTGHPNCGDGQDQGDDGDPDDSNDHEDGDNNDSDDPNPTPDSGSISTGDDGGRNWDGFDHDIEFPDDCTASRVGGETGTPSPSPTINPCQQSIHADICCFTAEGVSGQGTCPSFASVSLGGDANCDGQVGAGDALSVVLYVSGAGGGCTGESAGDVVAGDANCSGDVNAADATQILMESAGLRSADC